MSQADLIRVARIRAGLTQQELAERIGTTQQYIPKLEKGHQTAGKLETVQRLADALDLTVDQLYLAAGKVAPDIIAWLATRPYTVAELRRHMQEDTE